MSMATSENYDNEEEEEEVEGEEEEEEEAEEIEDSEVLIEEETEVLVDESVMEYEEVVEESATEEYTEVVEEEEEVLMGESQKKNQEEEEEDETDEEDGAEYDHQNDAVDDENDDHDDYEDDNDYHDHNDSDGYDDADGRNNDNNDDDDDDDDDASSSYPDHSGDGTGGLRLGNKVPDFSANTNQGYIESFWQWKKGMWCILFSHPSDFTPVCTTEIAAMALKHPELKQLGCKLIGLSVDAAQTHQDWMHDIVAHYRDQCSDCEDTDNIDIEECCDFPIIADEDRKVAQLYGMTDPIHPANLTIRSVFMIDPDDKLMLQLSYPASVGRNVDEIMRCIKSLQLSYNQKSIATPVNWPNNHCRLRVMDKKENGNGNGNDSVVVSKDWKGSVFLLPSVTTEQALLNYPHYHTCPVPSGKNYLRLVQAKHVGLVLSSSSSQDDDDPTTISATTSTTSSTTTTTSTSTRSTSSDDNNQEKKGSNHENNTTNDNNDNEKTTTTTSSTTMSVDAIQQFNEQLEGTGMRLCDICGWNFGFADKQWRCMVCNEIQNNN